MNKKVNDAYMIIIEMSGGLGNQMFQYALYLKLKGMGKDVCLDISNYNRHSERRFELDVFDLQMRFIQLPRPESIKKIWLKLNGIRKIYHDKIGIFQPQVYELDDVYLRGYWQNEYYFADISDEIREAFSVKNRISQINKSIVTKMQQHNSVSVHIRRGDYLNSQFENIYGNICTLEYYKKAISYIYNTISRPHFFFFSDDTKWVREHISEFGAAEDQILLIDENYENNSFLDIYLMSNCKHHIIANSTFSWWGAWLGKNDDKIVVAPSKWFHNHETTDIICTGWIKI